nr:MAG TPA: hypothetical protein [Caudoviricetes sp.]DAJ04740.1 MAG TPA: hypothetical protein [Caudoviricetes sp.]DAL05439.1 MAG TPA: hypothetical protein [Caudoviricetes sp.]
MEIICYILPNCAIGWHLPRSLSYSGDSLKYNWLSLTVRMGCLSEPQSDASAGGDILPAAAYTRWRI